MSRARPASPFRLERRGAGLALGERAGKGELAVLAAAPFALAGQGRHASPVLLGHLLLVAGIVEGAVLVGWRLTQLPRSQALEFLLVSPLQPRRVFLGEARVAPVDPTNRYRFRISAATLASGSSL